jgi:hypothetical protein
MRTSAGDASMRAPDRASIHRCHTVRHNTVQASVPRASNQPVTSAALVGGIAIGES